MTSLTDQQKKCTFSNPLDLNFVTSSFDKLIKALIVFFFFQSLGHRKTVNSPLFKLYRVCFSGAGPSGGPLARFMSLFNAPQH